MASKSGKISNLPNSIAKDKVSFDRFENPEKFPLGPTIPNPGPIFPMQATTELKAVSYTHLPSESLTFSSSQMLHCSIFNVLS